MGKGKKEKEKAKERDEQNQRHFYCSNRSENNEEVRMFPILRFHVCS